jgi:carboxyl-terminal processing protease
MAMKRWAIGVSFAGAVFTTVMWQVFDTASAFETDAHKQLDLFAKVFDRVRSDYVERPDDRKLIEAAINGMLSSLDPHSSYMNAKNLQEMQIQTQGKFSGLGIEITMENGIVKVVSAIDDTPAARAGVMANDVIVKLDGKGVHGLALEEVARRIRGKVKTPITLTILRQGKAAFDVRLIRDEIKVKSVKSSIEGRDKDIGYIRISSFTAQTHKGLESAIASIKKATSARLKGYVIDLRNNPGGLLDEALSVSAAFLDRGEIVSTRGRAADGIQRFNAQRGDLLDGKALIVLINGGSASASEIVAGAVQDHKRATVIGTRSFGKGSVQTLIPLASQGAPKLTTARYYTPSGRSIQARGIDPDIVIEQELPPELQGKDTSTRGEASLRGHLQNEDGERGGSSAYVPNDKSKDLQLKAAIDVLQDVKATSKGKGAKSRKPMPVYRGRKQN